MNYRSGRNGKFIIEPLERGYGVTLGNSLRRVLLSSLPGVAVTNIKIDGVLHEISTITGVKEDVCEIVLNVKGITAKLHSDVPKLAVIDMTGPGEVTAGPRTVEILIGAQFARWGRTSASYGADLRSAADISREKNKHFTSRRVRARARCTISPIRSIRRCIT